MASVQTYFIKTFGCQLNYADSERLESALQLRGMKSASSISKADYVVINTCMIRESAENRIYGWVRNLGKKRKQTGKPIKIVLTGCMVGLAVHDKTGKIRKLFKKKLPEVDEFLHIDEIGFDHIPTRYDPKHAWVPISNGCNNYCSYCIVPYARGKEVSRPYKDIIKECKDLKKHGYESITLLGQNVNSYGADLTKSKKSLIKIKPVFVKYLGKKRIPTLFPHLLERIAKLGFKRVDFISANPWDFSSELIDVIARNKNITRELHIPLQSGDNKILKKMNRWYTRKEYLKLISSVKSKIPRAKISTDIIVGFPGETDAQFQNTVDICKKVKFNKAYVSRYSPRPKTISSQKYIDEIPYKTKKERWEILNNLINKKS